MIRFENYMIEKLENLPEDKRNILRIKLIDYVYHDIDSFTPENELFFMYSIMSYKFEDIVRQFNLATRRNMGECYISQGIAKTFIKIKRHLEIDNRFEEFKELF